MSETGRWDAPFEETPEGSIREEIFSAERLENHAEILALEHVHATTLRPGRSLAPRVRENELVLARCYRELASAVAQGRPVSPAAKWLLENYHLVSGLGKSIKLELPTGYYRGLPKLGRGELRGFPRIYELVWKWVAHCDSHFDSETLAGFIAAYQRILTLTIGELWAVPITLRIVLLENLRRQALKVVVAMRATEQADRLADLLLGLGPGPALDPVKVPGRFKKSTPPPAFNARLYQRLRDQDASVIPVLDWITAALAGQGSAPETTVRQVHQEQLTRNATCKNVITSLRHIALADWPTFVERVSQVDEIFRAAFDFQGLSFATRDRYRHAVEDLARGSRYSQIEIARLAVRNVLESQPSGAGEAGKNLDVGEFLIGPSRRGFERQIGFIAPLRLRFGRGATALGAPLYLGSLALVTAGILFIPMEASLLRGMGGLLAVALAFLAVLPASEIAVALVNHFAMNLWPPFSLPALGLKSGIPAALRTMVVIPVILEDEGGFRDLIETLEVHYLANPRGEVHFGLLTDWADAPVQEREGEGPLLAHAHAQMAELNRRHGPSPGGEARFGLYHRRRRFNAVDGIWMGWERKRGKLMEFNRLLKGAQDTGYGDGSDGTGRPPTGVRYVITLDQDTCLPRGSVVRLVGAMAHPLNRPRLSPSGNKVIGGFGILQPRISPSLPKEEEGTLFNRLSSGRAGADPYACAVSEVYQDLFGEGTYTGKGIYDVDAFEACLAGRVPENSMLSHDLFEGCFVRAGLASEIEFFEEFSGHYQAAAACKHRWVRGDWQLLPWIFGFASGAGVRLGIVPRWKMIDNLRRSCIAPASWFLLCAALFLPWKHAFVWSSFALAGLALPPLLSVLVTDLIPKRRDFSLGNHWHFLRQELFSGLLKFLFTVVMLPYDAWKMADAIARTLFRLFFSHRKMLQWTSSARSARVLAKTEPEFLRQFVAGPVAGTVLFVAAALLRPEAWPWAVVLAALWTLSPRVARLFSLPRPRNTLSLLGPARVESLSMAARQTWLFFETFVSARVHHLPPDNFQEDPSPVLAERSSPTNIGLYLLSCAAAQDFGWLAPQQLVERFELALDSMEALEKFQGHFFNWYDLTTLRPLEPRYISTVDSGNLAGHLVAARQCVLDLLTQPLLSAEHGCGMKESLALAARAAESPGFRALGGMQQGDLRAVLKELELKISEKPAGSVAVAKRIRRLEELTETLLDIAKSVEQEHGPAAAELSLWAGALNRERQGLTAYHLLLVGDAPDGFNPPLREAAGGFLALGLLGCAHAIEAFASRVHSVAERLQLLFDAMHFGFLYEPSKRLMSVGYRPAEAVLDASYYDLIASEARLASFVAVARGDVDVEHWFRLGRPFTATGHGTALLSWSGSMFEYLMPLLVMKSPPRSLFDDTYRSVVRRQRSFAADRGLPWGVSESAYNVRDKDLIYQYSDFGVEGLGMKGGLARPKVVAPYATALALMVDPVASSDNLDRLTTMSAVGTYGFYDALDFSSGRLPEGQAWAVVKTYMAHHQGMAMVSFLNVLKGGLMQARFEAAPLMKSAALLLQERSPRDVSIVHPVPEEAGSWLVSDAEAPSLQRSFDSPHQSHPQSHLLGNGNYSVMLSTAGGGVSRWNRACITRFRRDQTRETCGSFILIRDVGQGTAWSATYLPSRVEPDLYQVEFREDKAEYIRRDGYLESRLEVAVSPEDDIEVRRLALKNFGFRSMEIELTSFAELSLTQEAADLAHPAFAKLFVQTEYVANFGALLAHRRPQDPKEDEVWAAHLCVTDSGEAGATHYETDRARFLGRGRDIYDPAMGAEGRLFSNTSGAVLDPVFSLKRRLILPAGATAHVTFATMAASSREKVLALAAKVREGSTVERIFSQAWLHAQVQMRHRGIQPEEARLFQTLAGHLIYPDARLRPPPELQAKNRLGSPVLWSQGISGTLPILVLRIDEASDREILRQLVLAWDYWRLKNLAVDLVILNEEPASYAAEFQKSIEELVRFSKADVADGQAGAIHIVKSCLIPESERDLLVCSARAVLQAGHGSLFEQLARIQPHRSPHPGVAPPVAAEGGALPVLSLEFMNGLGGFFDEGREYCVTLEEGQNTPAPWINVVANPEFGFLVSESGSGYTWAHNARENKLSPWSNDPVSDPPGEAIYVRDEESGVLFTPTALPIRLKDGRYRASHGQGYSRFESAAQGIQMTLTQFVPPEDPVKISRMTVKNLSGRTRRLSLTAYAQWVLGTDPQSTGQGLVTEWAGDVGSLTARNPFNPNYPEALAFLDVGDSHTSFTADRKEFLGRNGSLRRPQGLVQGRPLSGKSGAGLDPCACIQSVVELKSGESAEFRVLLGQAEDRRHLKTLVDGYRRKDLDALLAQVKGAWEETLGALTVRTPDRAMDLMLNRWFLYQTLSCRVWARTAFYQCGGAYGFRDQLQDVLALTLSRPALVREHLLRCAGKQFKEGDVLHWWHPPGGAGVRTRITDDRLWLPYAAALYAEASGDQAIFEQKTGFLQGGEVTAGKDDLYFEPQVSSDSATLYEHCALALDCSLAVGPHGLPLMGGGDWNDGMNRVGSGGKGESVWLAWFLVDNLRRFGALAVARGEMERAAQWQCKASALVAAAEAHAWDGDWYRRAFFDDGSPLGSAGRAECRIDSIAQSWAVLSKAAEPARAARAMAALDEYLWRKNDGLQVLLAPPFSKSSPDPGYIMGYPPGIRENGGQYNHAAAWSVAAFAGLGDGAKAQELFAMLNPARIGGTRAGMQRYKIEPYVMAGDVYSQPPYVGRGGWSWYTGSAAWMYRVGMESILGFSQHGEFIRINPCIPPQWPGFEMTLRKGGATWDIRVSNPEKVSGGVRKLVLDDETIDFEKGGQIPFKDDQKAHVVWIVLGTPSRTKP